MSFIGLILNSLLTLGYLFYGYPALRFSIRTEEHSRRSNAVATTPQYQKVYFSLALICTTLLVVLVSTNVQKNGGFIQNFHFEYACNLHFCLPFYFICYKNISSYTNTKAKSKANEHLPSFIFFCNEQDYFAFKITIRPVGSRATHHEGFNDSGSSFFDFKVIHSRALLHCLTKQYTPSQTPF